MSYGSTQNTSFAVEHRSVQMPPGNLYEYDRECRFTVPLQEWYRVDESPKVYVAGTGTRRGDSKQ